MNLPNAENLIESLKNKINAIIDSNTVLIGVQRGGELILQKIYFKKKINIFYLGPAWDDWSNQNNSTYAALHGLTLRPGEEEITGDISNASMLDEEFTNINMMIKYYKFGFGRATDFVNESIRVGEMTREEGIRLVEKYDGVCDDTIIDSYCKYIDISIDEFWSVVHSYTNKGLFDIKEGLYRPQRKFSIG